MSGKVLVYGGKGALGSTCIELIKSKQMWTCSMDLKKNEEADANILMEVSQSWEEQEKSAIDGLKQELGDDKLDAVITVAGGWAGGNASDSKLISSADLMLKQSVWSSVIAARVASLFLKKNGLLVLTGAQPAIQGTPGMIGYGMAKAAVHQLVKSLAGEKSGLPDGCTVCAILPITLDTPMNRKFMPDADKAKWTPMPVVANKFIDWLSRRDLPENGSLIQLVTENAQTKFVPV